MQKNYDLMVEEKELESEGRGSPALNKLKEHLSKQQGDDSGDKTRLRLELINQSRAKNDYFLSNLQESDYHERNKRASALTGQGTVPKPASQLEQGKSRGSQARD